MGELMTDPTMEPQAEARSVARVWEQWCQHSAVCPDCHLDGDSGPGCGVGVSLQWQIGALSTGLAALQRRQWQMVGWA